MPSASASHEFPKFFPHFTGPVHVSNRSSSELDLSSLATTEMPPAELDLPGIGLCVSVTVGDATPTVVGTAISPSSRAAGSDDSVPAPLVVAATHAATSTFAQFETDASQSGIQHSVFKESRDCKATVAKPFSNSFAGDCESDEGRISSMPHRPGRATFFDPDAMKEKVRQNMTKPKYNVTDLYKRNGIWQAMARDSKFEQFALFIIGLNSLWMLVDTDHNTAGLLLNAHWVFQCAENFFCGFFTFELFVRYMSFRRSQDGFKDMWFVFDFGMMVMMVTETWGFTVFVMLVERDGTGGGEQIAPFLRVGKLMRLVRMCRMARLLRALPELMIMIKGLMAASRSVFFTLVLGAALVFAFAIAFSQMTTDTALKEVYFSNVAASMYFLMVHGALLLSTDYKAFEIQAYCGILVSMLFFTFVLFAAVLIMNMLIGVLCQVVVAVACTEREELLVAYVHAKLKEVMSIIDEDGGGTISRDEFMQILENIDAMDALQDVGVDVVGLIDFADFIFGDVEDTTGTDGAPKEVELTLPDFTAVILQLRGSNNATVKDIVDLRKFVTNSLQRATRLMDSVEVRLMEISDMIDSAQIKWEKSTDLLELTSDETDSSSDQSSLMADGTPLPPKFAIGQPVVSPDPLSTLSMTVLIHGTWYVVVAPSIPCKMMLQDTQTVVKAVEGASIVEEPGLAETPFLPSTSDGLTGVQVVGFCILQKGVGASSQAGALDRPNSANSSITSENSSLPTLPTTHESDGSASLSNKLTAEGVPFLPAPTSNQTRCGPNFHGGHVKLEVLKRHL
eukprot:TRINITY_DN19214_c0_g1_i1.p1 TRINITY_DN19214_c0_g1~~TRINITY_DN19214_c0_g1_i1.p1  ORF type:complete len:792 (-),score=121.90 TRINITY_DN19214_c0_g1_i1:31-2406(-)